MKQKRQLRKIIVAAVLFASAFLVPPLPWLRPALFAAAYLTVGLEIIQKAVRNIFYGQVFDENFLMTVATLGAFGLGEYSEGVAVMLFYQVGEFFQSYAVAQSRKSIAGLMNIRPDYANLLKDGKIVKVSPEEVSPGDVIVVKPGERIPLDGKISRGSSLLDTSAITGESLPREAEEGDEVISGCINLNRVLEIRVTKEYSESTVVKILDLVENASSKKPMSNSSSPGLPVIIRRLWFWPQSPLLCCRRFFPLRRLIMIGFTGRSLFWLFPAPVRWSFRCL